LQQYFGKFSKIKEFQATTSQSFGVFVGRFDCRWGTHSGGGKEGQGSKKDFAGDLEEIWEIEGRGSQIDARNTSTRSRGSLGVSLKR